LSTFVDKQNHHLFQPHQVATAALPPADIAAPIRSILRDQDSVHVVLDEVAGVDTEARSVRFACGRELDHDALVPIDGRPP
jgi:NADH dehydrogenase FAD-containing subunit